MASAKQWAFQGKNPAFDKAKGRDSGFDTWRASVDREVQKLTGGKSALNDFMPSSAPDLRAAFARKEDPKAFAKKVVA